MAVNGVVSFGNGVVVTGINTASGTVDDLGVWNTGIDIQAILTTAGYTLPAAASAIVIRMINLRGTASRWGGVRTNGETIAELQRDMTANDEGNFVVVPFNGTNFLLDFYIEEAGATTVKFTIESAWVGYVNTPIATRVNQSGTSNALAMRTLAELPASASFIGKFATTGGKWCPADQTVVQTNTLTGYQLMRLDALKRVQLQSSVVMTPCGYWPDGIVVWETWPGTIITPIADSAWHDSTFIKAGKEAVFGYVDKSTSSRYDIRPKGSSRAISVGISSVNDSFFGALDTSGESQYYYVSAAVGTFVYQATFDKYTGAATAIDIPATIKVGSPVTIVPTGFASAITTVQLKDTLNNTINVAVSSNIFTPPLPASGVQSVLFGTIVATATGGVSTAADETTLLPATGYAYTIVNSPSSDPHSLYSLLLAEGITLVNGCQIYYSTADETDISADTIVETDATEFITCYVILLNGATHQVNYYVGPSPSVVVVTLKSKLKRSLKSSLKSSLYR